MSPSWIQLLIVVVVATMTIDAISGAIRRRITQGARVRGTRRSSKGRQDVVGIR